jgi:ferritin-like metal-binding protein YciE
MQTAHDLFLHEISDMLDAERRILQSLSELSQESSNSSLQSAFQSHHKQTEGQIERLEQCFELLEEVAEETECAGIKGLWEEHQTIADENPSPDILDVFNVGAAIKVERYEISSYESLINLAEFMKQTKVARLLKQNLKEEEQTLKKMSTLATKIKPESLGTNQDEQDESSAEGSAGDRKQGLRIVRKSGSRRNRAA